MLDLKPFCDIFPPMAEFIRRIWDRVNRYGEPTLYGSGRSWQTARLDPGVEYLRALASVTEGQESIVAHMGAATRSAAAFRTIGEVPMTSDERILRGRYAEVAVTEFLSAGELEEATTLGEEALRDPLLPEISRAKIEKALEISG